MRILLVAAAFLVSSAAHAEETRFLCGTEDAVNAIAEKIVVSQHAADEAATPFLDQGVCTYLPRDIRVDVVYHGKVYGQSNFRVEVVGFMDTGNMHMFYGLMQKDADSI